jgi:hypothetical protein
VAFVHNSIQLTIELVAFRLGLRPSVLTVKPKSTEDCWLSSLCNFVHPDSHVRQQEVAVFR